MKSLTPHLLKLCLPLLLVFAYASPSSAQIAIKANGATGFLVDADPRVVLLPNESSPNPATAGVQSHTNHLMVVKASGAKASVPYGETPSTIRSVYNLPSTGGTGIIAIVDAYDYGTALNDFNVFAKQYGLPTETSTNVTASTNKVFQVVYGTTSGSKPPGNAGWNMEAALDIEWAHAIAPSAKIVLVEAASASNTDLFTAIATAKKLSGVKEVSMSWGESEFYGETSYDSTFNATGIIFVAASGDVDGYVNYPGCSPNVVSVGGTTIVRSATGAFTAEKAWVSSGGGPSALEALPSYQSGVNTKTGAHRGVPDVSFDADPSSGVSIYDSTTYAGYTGWLAIGGTSVASPCFAGVINLANSGSTSSAAELTLLYKGLGASTFRDITVESSMVGYYPATTGYDFITGIGSPLGTTGK